MLFKYTQVWRTILIHSKLTKLFGIENAAVAQNSGKILIIVIYIYIYIISGKVVLIIMHIYLIIFILLLIINKGGKC